MRVISFRKQDLLCEMVTYGIEWISIDDGDVEANELAHILSARRKVEA